MSKLQFSESQMHQFRVLRHFHSHVNHLQVVIAWIYLSLDDTPAPDKNYNWKFLEDPFAD